MADLEISLLTPARPEKDLPCQWGNGIGQARLTSAATTRIIAFSRLLLDVDWLGLGLRLIILLLPPVVSLIRLLRLLWITTLVKR